MREGVGRVYGERGQDRQYFRANLSRRLLFSAAFSFLWDDAYARFLQSREELLPEYAPLFGEEALRVVGCGRAAPPGSCRPGRGWADRRRPAAGDPRPGS